MNKAVEDFWMEFLEKTNRPTDTKYIECFHFELTERVANKLLELVLSGRKRATASSLYSWQKQGMDLPKPGDLSIVTDWDGNPRCVIETTKVTLIPFKDIDYDTCKREGEDDDLESWRQGHIKFFTAEGAELGYEFSWDLPVAFEDFDVVYKV